MSRYIYFIIALFLGIYLLISPPASAQMASQRRMIVKETNFSLMVMPVRVTIHPSMEDLNEAFKARYHSAVKPVAGWYDIDLGVCEIHVLGIVYVKGDPNMAVWGHELTHCVHGNFHPSNK